MARKQADPFGFLGAINWDAVDEHADEIAAVFNGSEECAGCSHARRDHFEGKGVCDLGFCRLGCMDFVEPQS